MLYFPGTRWRVLTWFVCTCVLAGIVLGTGCQMSTRIRDLEPARDQPSLEKVPGEN